MAASELSHISDWGSKTMGSVIQKCALPDQSLLRRYHRDDHYTDCYRTVVTGAIAQADYVFAFYTTRLFKLERLLLSRFANRPSTDSDVQQLAAGAADTFAAWVVEQRENHQILLSDYRGRTRSWLMSEPVADAHKTTLYFGSAVVPIAHEGVKEPSLGFGFRALLGFHKLYSRALLRSARKQLLN